MHNSEPNLSDVEVDNMIEANFAMWFKTAVSNNHTISI